MGILKLKNQRKVRKIRRVRKKVNGTKEKPRVAFTQSNKNIYVQVIDDRDGKTLVSVSSVDKDIEIKTMSKKNKPVADILADKLYEKLSKNNIENIVIDRRFKKYHGVIKTFSDKLREKGIKF